MSAPQLTKIKGGSVFRKIAMGSWRTAGDPSVYGLLELDMSESLKFISELQTKTDVKISVSHLVGKVVAKVLTERPEINGLIRFSRIYQRKHVDLFYQVNVPGSQDDPVGKALLTGATVRKAETLSIIQIAEDLNKKSRGLKAGEKGELSSSLNTLKFVPWKLMRFVLDLTSFITFDLRLNLSWAGVPQDPFGSVMITNVGGLGIDTAWAPLVPYSRVPLLLTLGAIKDRPWVVNGKIEVRPVMRVGITFDHRFMDGVHASQMSQIFTSALENPHKHLT